MKKVFLLASAILLLTLAANAQLQTFQYPQWSDPCQSPNILKLSVPVHITTATTTELVAASAGKTVYVCAYSLVAVGTGATTFKTGTKVSTACDTGATSITGSPLFPTTTLVTTAGTHVQFAGASGGELCVTTASGATSLDGFVDYVQQ